MHTNFLMPRRWLLLLLVFCTATLGGCMTAPLGTEDRQEEIRLSGARSIKVSTVTPWATDTPFFEHAANYSRGTVRHAAMDDPEKAVDAIIWASIHPREEVSVGWKGKASYASHHIAPDLTERMSADVAHNRQIVTAPPAPPASGTLFDPMQSGRTVDGGVRTRMRLEDEARKQREKDHGQ